MFIRVSHASGYHNHTGCDAKEEDNVSGGECVECKCVEGEGVEGESVMETDTGKSQFSKRYLEKLSKAWKGRREKRKRKRLARTKKGKW